ncbi:DUF2269 domain-containing protein [Paenibacillus radicis (ex Xue et al. 2023)]|uniref:DUF2269 domain-containing protein n=1 Tax=Paenibacillus radicis (ex Xue et al. 2023) TaxID=2972489 RepID=A0ABT1YPW8_9BACL|nr:DUF2269 domain-containing protein [Paenibacillus radicis (ex Xue et al. 2023)]MCR8635222.1 DUF2269 domain-containing protein [Paenibacillus radicis (ex Xue et al. 2023)]
MGWLVVIHVVSSIVGIGPTFFGHVLFRKKQQREELKQSLALFQLLNYFPKIGGTIAVLSGVALVALSGWKFTDLWIWISLVLYVLIQVVAVGMLGPVMSQLIQVLNGENGRSTDQDTSTNKAAILLSKANRLYNTASIMGIILILLMILKPM